MDRADTVRVLTGRADGGADPSAGVSFPSTNSDRPPRVSILNDLQEDATIPHPRQLRMRE